MKTRERELARRLRRVEGAAIGEIARRLRVSMSSVSLWVRDIELTTKQREALLQRNPAYNRQLSGWTYWAEGAKHRNTLRFTNSDPEMVRFFVKFLRACFELEDELLRLTCNLFADHVDRQREIEQFRLEVAGLPDTCLCKSSVNVYSKYSQKKRRNKLPYGTCRIAVSRTRVVQSIFGGIQEIAGFERSAWLE